MSTSDTRAATSTSHIDEGSMAPTTGKEIITVPNDVRVSANPFDDFVVVHTAETALFETMRIPALMNLYTRILMTTTNLTLDETIDTVQAITDGLTTLHLCSDILNKPSHPRDLLFYIWGLGPALIASFSKTLSIIFETNDWTVFEREALEKGDFEISPVVWAVMLGPRGLVKELVKGRRGAEAVLGAEEEWIEVKEGDEGFEKSREALRWFARELVKAVEEVGRIEGE
ncbi:hypothetical protein PtrSN002B_002595 [Pyrenophora tritici-repentis]|uniref:DUF1421 multi-domain protein n=2 Tax=Pyrenophora tritici-repentis TaxID=45151 RepID=A0A2W1EDS0_9PLEO|nr:uncharacterized protein PTRG_01707 [Pyrenophora tritici-repentis Pt-1C-BFP]KAA8626397.1 hypothetical protein PtrV1_02077 [Pyrenophora tritici-repentis]EDU41145.1 predicted protein [Pyrenophora tritici-repentis Pt-1C-BFP]KAF7454814.1 hypothetical protein A1F99_020720 [Pyrenophora tritici-repentis]KAF7577946.1 DUF1421 multi-domain protein [Pyrenophora tritici-repentis]KAG9388574.1 hypothetical protein A1F94_001466 [Pyrenophora tritici-repentis]